MVSVSPGQPALFGDGPCRLLEQLQRLWQRLVVAFLPAAHSYLTDTATLADGVWRDALAGAFLQELVDGHITVSLA